MPTQRESPRDWASSYLSRGWSPIPLKPHDKQPAVAAWQRLTVESSAIESTFPETHNVGLALGPQSRNLLDVDLDEPVSVRLAPAFLPATETVFGRPAKPKSHYLYQAGPDETIRRRTFLDPDGSLLVEIRGEGHQTMVPPSIHPHGDVLSWDTFSEPGTVTIHQLEQATGALAAAAMLARHWHDWPHRHHTIVLSLTGGLLRAGWSATTTMDFIKAVCTFGNDDDWEDRRKAVESTCEKFESGETELTGFPRLSETIGDTYVSRLFEWLDIETNTERTPNTDHGNALRLVDAFGDRLRYVPEWGKWIIWDATRWKPDDSEQIYTYARQIPKRILEEAVKEKDDERAGALAKWANKSQDVARLNALIRLGKTDPRVIVTSAELDRDPWLFNVQNGTVNLMTGGLQAHDPNDLITKLAPVPYDPGASAPLYREYLTRVLQDDADMIGFLQRIVGYSLTGLTSEQVFTICWGPSGTGKTTLLETLRGIMGDYATHADASVFMAKQQRGRATPEIARLQGARLVTASETEEGAKMALSLVKALSGGDRMTASNLYAAPFEFDPVLKLWIGTNYKPRIPADEQAVWDRLVFLPFEVQMRNHPERRKDLKEALIREYPGILAWAVEGTQLWRRDGLTRPDAAAEAMSEYQHESDELGDFLEENTITVEGAKVKSSALYASYKAWAIAAGFTHPMNVKRFKQKMLGRGYELKTLNSGNYWTGLDLAMPTPATDGAAFSAYGRPARTNA